jgi:hypothetical protein
LCHYAKRKGVRILPGVGTSAYGGYYYEGNHAFNIGNWLAEHPDLRSIDQKGRHREALCPRKPENQAWLIRGANWLFENFTIGGVNLEMGDFLVCHCDECMKARAAIPSNELPYFKDLAVSYSGVLRQMRRLSPSAWLSYATYSGFTAEMTKTPPGFLSRIPDDTLCQWTLTRMVTRWPKNARPMATHNVGYLHWCNRSTRTEDDFYLWRVRNLCKEMTKAGFEGFATYGELSNNRPNSEIFYLALEAFLWDPEMTVERFIAKRLAPLYGCARAAKSLKEIIPLVRTQMERSEPENCSKAIELSEISRSNAAPEGRKQWDRLIAYLKRQERMALEQIKGRDPIEARARSGRRIRIASVDASDEDEKKFPVEKAIDGRIDEPGGYWLTRYTHPTSAWVELRLAQPSKFNRVVLFHQLNPRYYRSLDYTIHAFIGGRMKSIVEVKENQQSGWVAHSFDAIVTDVVRLEISRAAHDNRMGIGEIELRWNDE